MKWAFSKRRQAIETTATAHGYRSPKSMELAALRTRTAERGVHRNTLFDAWRAGAIATCGDRSRSRRLGGLSNKTALAMVFKLVEGAQELAPPRRPRPVAKTDPRSEVRRRLEVVPKKPPLSRNRRRPVSHGPQAPSAGTPTAQSLVFAARIAILRQSILVDGKEIRLQPGMAVTVEISTGRRRAIDYVLGPLREIQAASWHER